MRKPRSAEENEYDAQVGRRIERIRNARGIRAKALAYAIGIEPSRLSGFECGRRCPAFLLMRMACHFRVCVLSLLTDDPYCISSQNEREKHIKLGSIQPAISRDERAGASRSTLPGPKRRELVSGLLGVTMKHCTTKFTRLFAAGPEGTCRIARHRVSMDEAEMQRRWATGSACTTPTPES